MNLMSLGMDGLLALLLLTALAVGVRLNGKLKALRASQGDFVKAVGALDAAAARAESGLAGLRAATQEAHDLLLSRIEAARALAPRLEKGSEEAATASARLEAAVRDAEAAARRIQAQVQAQASVRPAVAAAPSLPNAIDAPLAFPSLRADPSEFASVQVGSGDRSQSGLEAARAAVERIMAAEGTDAPLTLSASLGASSRLARFVARRQGVRA